MSRAQLNLSVAALLPLFAISCVTTAPVPLQGSEKVEVTKDADRVKDCRVLGDVQAKGPYAVPDEWKMQFQNQAVQLGADTVLLKDFSVGLQTFNGTAYSCAQPRVEWTAPPAVPAPAIAPPPALIPPAAPPAPVQAPARSPSADEAHVIKAMETMYLAASTDDLDLFHSVAAPDFFAFDSGERFDGDALMGLIKSLHASGKTYVWSVTQPRVEIFGETALITYVNRGSLQDESGKKDLTWLESAVLRKDQGTWRIRFFHSTRVP